MSKIVDMIRRGMDLGPVAKLLARKGARVEQEFLEETGPSPEQIDPREVERYAAAVNVMAGILAKEADALHRLVLRYTHGDPRHPHNRIRQPGPAHTDAQREKYPPPEAPGQAPPPERRE